MSRSGYQTVASAVFAIAAAYAIFAGTSTTTSGDKLGPNQFGPYDTALQHGYEPANVISPIVPASYPAVVGPRIVGMQFLGNSQKNLRRDHFAIQIQGRTLDSPNVFWNGLVGRRLRHPLGPGTYQVTFQVTGFGMKSPTWTITVKPGPRHPQPGHTLTVTLLAALNTVRRTLGLRPAHQSLSLDLSSQAHAQYLSINGFSAPSFHVESSARPGFTGANPWNRALYFGWPTPETGEVGVEWSIPTQTPTVMQDLIDTIFHRLCLLSGNLESVGVGDSSGSNGAVVMDLGYGYRAELPRAIVYPFDGQSGVPTSWTDIESPDPVNGGYDRRFGYPITADFPTVDKLSQVKVQLWDKDRPLQVVIDEPGVGDLGSNQVGVVPRYPLRPNTWYRVTISAQALFNNGTASDVHIAWRFATGASNQSLSAITEPLHHLVFADVVCGSGVPCANQPLTLYRRDPSGALIWIAKGRTNKNGLWGVTAKTGQSGYYEARSQTKNTVLFWWGG